MERAKACALAVATAGCLLSACGGSVDPEPGEIETVDVAPGRTSILTTAYDEAAPARQESSLGVLPSDFPADLPLYRPANLTDFGDSNGGRFVLLFSPDKTSHVRQGMEVELRRTGWALIDGDGERGTYRRGSRSVILDIREAQPGTEIRVEY